MLPEGARRSGRGQRRRPLMRRYRTRAATGLDRRLRLGSDIGNLATVDKLSLA